MMGNDARLYVNVFVGTFEVSSGVILGSVGFFMAQADSDEMWRPNNSG